jgi:hypothetical protein
LAWFDADVDQVLRAGPRELPGPPTGESCCEQLEGFVRAYG